MKYLSFKNNDRMPLLGLGTGTFDSGAVYKAIRQALRVGFRHIDCAPTSGNEAEIGRAVREVISDRLLDRKDLWITSKFPNTQHGIDYVRPALEKSLNDLQMDYLDLYLIQWPSSVKADDPKVPLREVEMRLRETWSGLEQCLNAGLVRHIGVCDFNMEQLKRLSVGARVKPELNQVDMHPFLPQQCLVNYCHANLIHMASYSPFGSIALNDGMAVRQERALIHEPVIKKIAARRKATPAQILISWSVHRNISVLLRSTKEHKLRENFESLSISLTADDMDKIDSLEHTSRLLNGDDVWQDEGSPYETSDLWEERR